MNLINFIIHIILHLSTRLPLIIISISCFYFIPKISQIQIQNQNQNQANLKIIEKNQSIPLIFKLNSNLSTNIPNSISNSTKNESYQFKPYKFQEKTSVKASISSECLEEFISSGTRCASLINPKPEPIDLLWTWVNESTPLGGTEEDGILKSGETKEYSPYLYRQHDELKYSMRSSLESLPKDYINSRIILTAHNSPHEPYFNHTSQHILQHWAGHPNWLNLSLVPQFPVWIKHHPEIFHFTIPCPLPLNQSSWFLNHVPSHNSLAIESQFGHLTGVKKNFIYLNDDCFFINKFGEGDFTSELYGPVFRIQFDLDVDEDTKDRSGTAEAQGEWPSLGYSNYLLNLRFGTRRRKYIHHVVKVSNIQIIKEVSKIWQDEIFLTASSRFRGQRREINLMFLTTWYQIEKHREAMLHSFLMLKSDSNQDGIISNKERKEMMEEITGKDSKERIIKVFKPFRSRLESIEEILGDYKPLQTDYEWLSSDGYPLINPNIETIPNYQTEEKEPFKTIICELNITQCFPKKYRNSEDLMRWISIENPSCGDCLINLLIGKRRVGMESFLPPLTLVKKKKITFSNHLFFRNSFSSFHPNSSSVSFFSTRLEISSSRLLPPSLRYNDPRAWAIRNLLRYQYVIGNTPSDFTALTTTHSSKRVLNDLSNKFNKNKKKEEKNENENEVKNETELKNEMKTHDGLLVTLNDRIHQLHLEQVRLIFKNWLQSSWPIPAPWESNSINPASNLD